MSAGLGDAGRSAVCREGAIENLHDKILPPIHPDELLKSKMTFCNNAARAAPEFSQMKRYS